MALLRRLVDIFLLSPLRELRCPPKGQLPALDFLRSCAVLGVLVFHFGLSTYLPLGGSRNWFSRSYPVVWGRVGVDLFFVLSGYFIGRQLWRELRRTGTLQLRRFLVRRGLRIWPLYYVVLAYAVMTRPVGSPPTELWVNVFFLSNYFPQHDVLPGSWTLSVEEQFYIFIPLLLLAGVFCRVPLRGYRWILLALLAASPVVRILIHWSLTGDLVTPVSHDERMAYLYKPFHVRADCLLMGSLLAHLEVVDGDRFKWRYPTFCYALLITAAVFVLLLRFPLFYPTGCAVFFGCLTWFLIAHRGRWSKLIEAPPFYVISRLSYGMYLNHFYLLYPLVGFTLKHLPGARSAPGLNQMTGTVLLTVASIGAAVVTFCLIESPFLRLRNWLLSTRLRSSVPALAPQTS